jgi:hypothetical protein
MVVMKVVPQDGAARERDPGGVPHAVDLAEEVRSSPEGVLEVAMTVREMAGEVVASFTVVKKKLVGLLDRLVECMPDQDLDDVCEDSPPEVVVDAVATMVDEVVSSHLRLEEILEDVRLGLDMSRVEFESFKSRGCRPRTVDLARAEVAVRGVEDQQLRDVLDDAAAKLREVLGDG